MESPRKPWEFEEPLCEQIGGDMFYMSDKDDPQQLDYTQYDIVAAKKVCNSCIHIEDCREWGIKHESYGVWGGLSSHELSLVRKKRNINLKTITLFNMYS